MYEHLNPLREKLLNLEVESPIDPWKKTACVTVGGLISVGFDRHSDNLLIVSHQGRGVVDCCTGEKTARDCEHYYEDKEYLEAEGIGDLKGKTIRMAGLYGGGLPISTVDGWQLESVTLNFPEATILLVEPDSELYGSVCDRPDNFIKVEQDACIRAYGFSYTGKSFIIATTSDVTIYAREFVEQ